MKQLSHILSKCFKELQARAQNYDDASNMSGKFNRCQAEIKKIPLILYVHCDAYASNLVIGKANAQSNFIQIFLRLKELHKGQEL